MHRLSRLALLWLCLDAVGSAPTGPVVLAAFAVERVLSLAVIELLNDLESTPEKPRESAPASGPEPEAKPLPPPTRAPKRQRKPSQKS